MIGFVEKVLAYTEGLDQECFVASGLNYDATLRNLELIGEAATNIPDEVRKQYPQIPWRKMVATRNKLIHGYLGIDNDTLWSISGTMCRSCWMNCRSSRPKKCKRRKVVFFGRKGNEVNVFVGC